MKRIAIIDYGTFCDFKLTNTIIQEALKKYRVTYITSVSNKLVKETNNLKIIRYNIDTYLDLTDIDLINQNKIHFDTKYLKLIYYFNTIIKKLLTENLNNIEKIFIHYPAFMLLSVIPKIILDNTKIVIFYVAPAYPNKSLPWIFTNKIKTWKEKKNKEYTSSYNILKALSLLGFGYNYLYNILLNSSIVAMWDPVLFKIPKSEFKVKQIGAITNTQIKTWKEQPEVVTLFLKNPKDTLIYVSLGSFNIEPKKLFQIVSSMLSLGKTVLLHGNVKGIPTIDNLFLLNGFIPHEYIIPKVSLVLTSGSYCMTSIANKEGVQLIYLPILNEQFFWAINYKNKTGQDYLKMDKGSLYTQTSKILNYNSTSKKVKDFTELLKSKYKNDNTKKLLNVN